MTAARDEPEPPSGFLPVVEVRDLSKIYRLYSSPWQRLAERLTRRSRHAEHVAVQGVSFRLEPGEGLGIIGQNGAGKSTLLKMLAGVLEPSRGTVRVNGTISSILELGAGFHPEFSGAQNIRINAAMLGLDAAAVAKKTPAIIEFCELGEFIDRPVKVYSSGMTMRLAFAIATQVDPDVLIVDEALSVGDGYFQKKCTDRILELMESGTALLFCSHAMYYVERFCPQSIWLRHGRVAEAGPTASVIAAYQRELDRKIQIAEPAAAPSRDGESLSLDEPPQPAGLEQIEVLGASSSGGQQPLFRPEELWAVEVSWWSERIDLAFHVGIGVDRTDGVQVFSLSTLEEPGAPLSGHRRYRCRFEVPRLPINNGELDLYVFLADERGVHIYDRRILHAAFRVESTGFRFGLVPVRGRFSWSPANADERDSSAIQAGAIRSG